MTREETKSCIGTIKMLQRLAYNIHGVMDVIDADNCKKIIKALEQEPCEDAISLTKEAYSDLCLRASKADDLQRALDMEKGAYNALVKNIQCEDAISRQAAIDACLSGWNKDYKEIVEEIRTLPPVTPQQKTGRWIGDGNYICSCCKCNPLDVFLEPLGLDGGSYMSVPMKYCPNCGAKMAESEDKTWN